MTATVTKSTIFNNALTRHLGERALSTAEMAGNTQERSRVLNSIWNDSFVEDCLGDGLWTFATRTSMFDFSPSVQPDFGYRYSYNLPEDLLRTAGIWTDERLKCPLLNYAEEAGYWFCDIQTVYISYISSDASYGGDMSRWPAEFCRWIECYLAWQGCLRITGDAALEARLEKRYKSLLLKSRSRNAMQKPTTFLPAGRWVRARLRNSRTTSNGGGTW